MDDDGCLPGSRCECGNLLIDPGESCDDGNTVDSDGCLPGCHDPALKTFADGFESGDASIWSAP